MQLFYWLKKRSLTTPALALLVLLHFFVLARIEIWRYLSGSLQLWDFDVYYHTARDVLSGANPYRLPYMQTLGPPLVILPFVPFLLLPLQFGRSLVILISLIGVYATGWVLAGTIAPKHRIFGTLLLSFLLLLCFPVRFNFDVGQLNLVVMLLVAVVLTSANQRLQGVSAGIMAVIKTNYVLLLLAFLKHSRSAVITAAITLCFSALLSLLLFRPSAYQTFFTERAQTTILSSSATVGADYYNQSLRATIARFHMEKWYLTVLIILAVAGLFYVLKTGDVYTGLLLSLLLSPVVWQHYLPVIYPAIILKAHRMIEARKVSWWFGFSVLLLVLHLPWLHGKSAVFPYNILASHYFIGLVALLGSWMHSNRSETHATVES